MFPTQHDGGHRLAQFLLLSFCRGPLRAGGFDFRNPPASTEPARKAARLKPAATITASLPPFPPLGAELRCKVCGAYCFQCSGVLFGSCRSLPAVTDEGPEVIDGRWKRSTNSVGGRKPTCAAGPSRNLNKQLPNCSSLLMEGPHFLKRVRGREISEEAASRWIHISLEYHPEGVVRSHELRSR